MLKVSLSLILIAVILTGCGGGGSDDIGSPGGGSGGGNYYMRITAFNVSPTQISNGSSFVVTWSVDYSSPANLYWVEFHMNNQNSLSTLTKHFYYNCDLVGSPCSKSGSVTCDVMLENRVKTNYLHHAKLLEPLLGHMKSFSVEMDMGFSRPVHMMLT